MSPFVTDRQWQAVQPILVGNHIRQGVVDERLALEGVLYVLANGCHWHGLPEVYDPATCYRYYRQWEKTGVWPRIWKELFHRMRAQERFEWGLAFLNGAFAPACKNRKQKLLSTLAN